MTEHIIDKEYAESFIADADDDTFQKLRLYRWRPPSHINPWNDDAVFYLQIRTQGTLFENGRKEYKVVSNVSISYQELRNMYLDANKMLIEHFEGNRDTLWRTWLDRVVALVKHQTDVEVHLDGDRSEGNPDPDPCCIDELVDWHRADYPPEAAACIIAERIRPFTHPHRGRP